jgi:beta-lactamase class D
MFKFKKLSYGFLVVSLMLSIPSFAASHKKTMSDSAFIAKKDNKVIIEIGNCKKRHSPVSTFKIALALMGFDSGILKNKDAPQWSFKEDYEKNFPSWYSRKKGLEYHWCQDHTPATFIKHSVLWFSHQITQRLGTRAFQGYVMRLNYGNKDVTGAPGKNDGLFNSWLRTSLKISPLEQVEFLEKLVSKQLDVSDKAQEKTIEIMDRKEEWDGWKLYGKTGGGKGPQGWFIGWVEKDGQRIVFAQFLDRNDPQLDLTGITIHDSVGLTAKEVIKKHLVNWLQ